MPQPKLEEAPIACLRAQDDAARLVIALWDVEPVVRSGLTPETPCSVWWPATGAVTGVK